MYGYIYKTTNTANGLIYIGQKHSNTFLGKKYLGSGKILKEAIAKYGKNIFEIEMIDTADTPEELDAKEIYWISKYNTTNRNIGYNICEGGKVCRTMVGENNPFYGKKHSEKAKKTMSEHNSRWMLGKHHSEETKKLIGDKNRGKEVSAETRDKLSKNAAVNDNYGMKGKTPSEDTKQKLSDKANQRWSKDGEKEKQSTRVSNCWSDPEYRANHINGMKGKKHKVNKTACPHCGKEISNSNLKRHEKVCKSKMNIE